MRFTNVSNVTFN